MKTLTLHAEDVFAEGSWWRIEGELVCVGGPAPEFTRTANRVYLYAPGSDLTICYLTFYQALAMIENGTLHPEGETDLSCFSLAEQEYYRSA